MKYSKRSLHVSIVAGTVAMLMATPTFSDTHAHAVPPVPFTMATVKPYVDEVHGFFLAMQGVKTSSDATVLAMKLKSDLQKMAYQHNQIEVALSQLGPALAANKGTPEMKQALDYWAHLGSEGPAMEAQMDRIVKLAPNLADIFHHFITIQESDVPPIARKHVHRRNQ